MMTRTVLPPRTASVTALSARLCDHVRFALALAFGLSRPTRDCAEAAEGPNARRSVKRAILRLNIVSAQVARRPPLKTGAYCWVLVCEVSACRRFFVP